VRYVRCRAALVAFSLLFLTSCSVYGFGNSGNGRLGIGPVPTERAPLTLVGLPSSWMQASAGGAHTCAVALDGGLWCWGGNVGGALGDGTTNDRLVPTRIGSQTWKSVSAGETYTCGIQTDDSLWCWGSTPYGHPILGVGDRTQPTKVDGAKWASVAASTGYHTCGIRLTGSLWCWGTNLDYELGDPSGADHATPYHVGSAYWASVTTGHGASCGIQTDGSLWCWGSGDSGQLGIDGEQVLPMPTEVQPGVSWSAIDLGPFHACGIRADGSLWCWGWNVSGQLGDGVGVDYQVPHRVGTETWRSVSAADYHSCGVRSDRTLWCWGSNQFGQLGAPGDDDELAPVQVGSAENWLAVSTAFGHTVATMSPV
jgi:alpha-tubulin suppressor-like RCC1 family protein